MTDLTSNKLIYLKAVLFVVIGITSAAILFLQNASLLTASLICAVIWSFARAYYFAFYVLERYVDPTYRFAGLFSLLRYLFRGRNQKARLKA